MIKFSKYIWLYFIISLIIILPGIYTLVRSGLRQGLDFSGGTLIEFVVPSNFDNSILEASASSQSIKISSLQKTNNNSVILRLAESNTDLIATFSSGFASYLNPSTPSAQTIRTEVVGPILGRELLQKALIAALLSIIGILSFIAYSFKDFKYGFAAILALIHDVLILISVFALLGKYMNVEVDTLFVTALLTTMSFSVHDTIVVFDRIREMKKKGTRLEFNEIADLALTQTIVRSLTNSFTIIFMLFALVLAGGESIKWFAMALLIGTISGTYSSPFIATPILILWNKYFKK